MNKGGIDLNIATVDVKVQVNENDFTERELKLLEVLFLNIAAPANAQITGIGLAFNPLSLGEKDIFYMQFAWQNSLEDKVYSEMKETLNRRFEIALKMSNIEGVTIKLIENSFATTI